MKQLEKFVFLVRLRIVIRRPILLIGLSFCSFNYLSRTERFGCIGIKQIQLGKLNGKDMLALAAIGFMVRAIAFEFSFGKGPHFIAVLSEL